MLIAFPQIPPRDIGQVSAVLLNSIRASIVVVEAKVEDNDVITSERKRVERRRRHTIAEALEHVRRGSRTTVSRRRAVCDVHVRTRRVGSVGERGKHGRPPDAHRVSDNDNRAHTRRKGIPWNRPWRAHKALGAVLSLRRTARVDCTRWGASCQRALASHGTAVVTLESTLCACVQEHKFRNVTDSVSACGMWLHVCRCAQRALHALSYRSAITTNCICTMTFGTRRRATINSTI